jgi:hypothetical protein
MVRKRVLVLLVVSLVLSAEAFGDPPLGCPYKCWQLGQDLAHCTEMLATSGTMTTCEEVYTCWPSIDNPIYCEASCRGPHCYEV